MESRKGISPLVAAVLLVAFTMAVAGLAGPFLTEITQKAQGDTDEKVQDIVSANDLQLEVMSVDFKGNGDYDVTIRNTGTSSGENFTVTIEGDDPVQKRIDRQLEPGEVYTFTVASSHTSPADEITVESRNLPKKTDFDLSNAETVTEKITWDSKKDWDDASEEKSVVHENTTNTSHSNASKLKLGYSAENPLYSSSLISYYPLQESSTSKAYDFSSDNDASLKDDVTQNSNGILGTSSYSFDGSNDYLQIGGTGTDPISSDAKHTITAWVKGGGSGQTVVGIDNTQNLQYEVFGSNGWESSFYDGSSWNNAVSGDTTTSSWVFLTLTYDGSTGEIYINGSQKDSVSTGTRDANYDEVIGARTNSPIDPFSGNIADVRIYDRTLSSSEINNLYNFTDGYLETDTRSLTSKSKPELNASTLLNSQTIKTTIIGSPSSGSPEKHTVSLNDGTANYDISWSSSHSQFKINVSLSTEDVTKTPVLKELTLYSP